MTQQSTPCIISCVWILCQRKFFSTTFPREPSNSTTFPDFPHKWLLTLCSHRKLRPAGQYKMQEKKFSDVDRGQTPEDEAEDEDEDSAICPHCHSADETVEHLVFQCPAHDHARRDTWPGVTFTTDPRRLWSYLEWIGAVSPPPSRPGMREREVYVDFVLKTCTQWSYIIKLLNRPRSWCAYIWTLFFMLLYHPK